MKKMICVILALALLLTMCGCTESETRREEFSQALESLSAKYENSQEVRNLTIFLTLKWMEENNCDDLLLGLITKNPGIRLPDNFKPSEIAWKVISNPEIVIEYIKDSCEQLLLGNYSDNVTLLGTTLQIGASTTGLDIPMDIRDLFADLENWEWTGEHLGTFSVDLIAIVPVIGTVKNFDEAVYLFRVGEDVGCATKNGEEIVAMSKKSEEIFGAAEYSDEVVDAVNPKKLVKMAAEQIPDEGYKKFETLKKHLPSAGPESQWHHIVEQSQIGKRANFEAEQVNNLKNIICIPNDIHQEISSAYSRLYRDGKILRDWIASKSYEEQMEFGLQMLQKFGTVTIENGRWVFTPFS